VSDQVKDESVKQEAEVESDHIVLENVKGEFKFYLQIPKKAGIGVTYDAIFDMLNHILKMSTDLAAKYKPKKPEENEEKTT
jgi:hypothetical protein